MPLTRTMQAILLMLMSMLGFSAMAVTIRMLGHELHSTQMVLMRNILSLLIVAGWSGILQRGIPRFRTARLSDHFWRGTFGIASMQLWFYSLTIMPITLATALSYTAPIFSAIIAILFLGEKAGIHRWSAILLSFVGVWVILRPDTSGIETSVFIVLAASFLMGISGAMVKTLTRTEPPETIVFYMSLFMIGWSFFPAIPFWKPFNAHQLWLVFLIALFSTAAHLCMTRALMRTDMVVLMPFDFARLIFTAFFAYMFFGETLSTGIIIGTIIMVAATVYIAHREARARKKAQIAGLNI